MAVIIRASLPNNASSYAGGVDGSPRLSTPQLAPPGTYRRLRAFVGVNTFNTAASVRLYKNGLPTLLFVLVPIGATGFFSNLVDTISFSEGDRYELVLEQNSGTTPGSRMILNASVERVLP